MIEACFPGCVVTGRDLPEGIDELVSRTEAGPVIVYRRGLPTCEQRFVIAHAIGHLVFDVDGGCRVGSVGDADREARADRFAAELLVPLEQLLRMATMNDPEDSVDDDLWQDMIDELAADFGVPRWVIDKRLRSLL